MTKFRKALCTILFFSLIVPCWVHALEIQSKNAILYNVNEDTVLFSKEPDEKVPIASLTKIMTAIMAIENISNMDEVVSIPSVALEGLAEKNAMVVGFKANERVTYLDLLYGILLPSGADATNVVAYYLAGSEENYVNLMNEKAKELGLVNTHFSDTSGLDDVHNYSTVSDIAKLLQYALHNETFKKIFTSQEYTTSNGLKLKSTLTYYTEQYHLQNEYIYGSKTGFTTIAGFCLASIAHHDGVEYLLVTTGAPTTNRYPYHFVDAFVIYEYFLENYGYVTLYNKNDVLYSIKTKYSKEDLYEIKAEDSFSKYLAKDTDIESIRFEYSGLEEITPFTSQKHIGTLSIYLGDELLNSMDVVYQGGLTLSIFSLLKEYDYFILILLLFFLVFFLFFKRNKLKHKKKKV